MRAGALTVLLLLLAAPLAGCAGSDGDVTVDLTPEEIQELMDANMDDFMDNMTVSINQNFYNNTSVDNHYNNTTSVDQSGASTSSTTTTYNYNGSAPDSELRVFTVTWDRVMSLIGFDPTTTLLTRPIYEDGQPGSYTNEVDYGIGQGPISNYPEEVIFVTSYNGSSLEITATCPEVYDLWQRSENQWEDWLVDNHGLADGYSQVAEDLRNFFERVWYWNSVADQCGFDSTYPGFTHTLFEISLVEGEAVKFVQLDQYVHLRLACDDGFSADYAYDGNTSGAIGSLLMGGQANCTVTGETSDNAYWYLTSGSGNAYVVLQRAPASSFAVYYEMLAVTADE